MGAAAPRAAVVLLAVLLAAVGCEGLRASWQQNDVPEGGFSQRGREEAARRKGKTYKDEYASPGGAPRGGSGYGGYYKKYYGKGGGGGGVVVLLLMAAGAAYLFRGGLRARVAGVVDYCRGAQARQRQRLRTRAMRPEVAAAGDDTAQREAARRLRVQRFAKLEE